MEINLDYGNLPIQSNSFAQHIMGAGQVNLHSSDGSGRMIRHLQMDKQHEC